MDDRKERLFFGVPLPADLQRELGALRTASPELEREMRWARQEGLHITLRFLGDAAPQMRESLAAGLAALSPRPSFRLECRGVGIFGSLSRPRVLWAGIEGELEPLDRLQQEIEGLSRDLGWPAETKRFRPHATLARARPAFRSRSSLEQLLTENERRVFGVFEASEVCLLRSELGPGGSVYVPVGRLALTSPSARL